MASKGAKIMKKAVEKAIITDILNISIPAGKALPGPPLGPLLGQRGINIAAFCKDFNSKTSAYKDGIPLPCRVKVNPDRSYSLQINRPCSSYLLLQAAGAERGAWSPGAEIAGKLTIKHIYEIAKIKLEDPSYELLTHQEMCEHLIHICHRSGLEVVKDLDPEEYAEFLKERKNFVDSTLETIRLKLEAKVLRK